MAGKILNAKQNPVREKKMISLFVVGRHLRDAVQICNIRSSGRLRLEGTMMQDILTADVAYMYKVP